MQHIYKASISSRFSTVYYIFFLKMQLLPIITGIFNIYGALPHGRHSVNPLDQFKGFKAFIPFVRLYASFRFVLNEENAGFAYLYVLAAGISLAIFAASVCFFYLVTNVLVRYSWKGARKYNELLLLALFFIISFPNFKIIEPIVHFKDPYFVASFLVTGGFHALGCLYFRHNRVVKGNYPPSWNLSIHNWFLLLMFINASANSGDIRIATTLYMGRLIGFVSQLAVETVIFFYKKTLGEWKPAEEQRQGNSTRRGTGGDGGDDDDHGGWGPRIVEEGPRMAEEKAPEAPPSYHSVVNLGLVA